MTKKQSNPGDGDGHSVAVKALRQRAEEAIRSKPATDTPTLRDEGRLLHELRVHQAELEMQNEELRQREEELETSRAKYHAFYNLAPVGYFTVSGEGLVLETNLTAANLLGKEPASIAGQPFTRLIAAEDQDTCYLFRKKLHETGKAYSCELKMQHSTGTLFWARLEGAAAGDAEDGASACYVVMTDITERKAAEEDLKEAKEKAEAATRLKDKFVSLVAHDVRSPLASMLLLQKATMQSHKDSRCDECRAAFGMTIKSCESMLDMTDKILGSASLRDGKVQLNRKLCNVSRICDSVMESMGHLAAKKGITLNNEVPPDARLYVDRVLFQRVIHNLFTNALKFSNEGGTVTVFQPGGKNILAVKDTGTGIEDAVLPDLFKHEVKTTAIGTSGERGTGPGLPMGMDIMKAHGGTIRVISRKGMGSTFFIELPDVKPLVLVADDDEVSTFVLRAHLERMGAEVVMAKNGALALEIIYKSVPAVIIADVKMPVMDGFTLLLKLKSMTKYSHVPVMIITGDTDVRTREKAFECMADDFITKPLLEHDFMPRIGRFIAG